MRKRSNKPMPKFKVERGVPLPRPREAMRLYPLAKMKPGDSFMFPRALHKAVAGSAYRYGKNQTPKWVFTLRPTCETKGHGRVWRVK